MNTKRSLTIHINLDGRILAVLLILVGVLFWAYVRAGAQNQGEPAGLDTNNPAAQQAVQPALPQPELSPQQTAPEPGMLPNTNLGWIKPEELGTPNNVQAPAGVTANPTFPRHVYLTNNSFACNAVLTACVTGYHMASLWEILDVTSWIYDYDQPAAFTKADSGWGPPSYWNGWVRTGGDASTSSIAGTGNCSNWTSVSTSSYGVSVRLSRTWETAPGDIFVWDATSYGCNFTGPVWCVRN